MREHRCIVDWPQLDGEFKVIQILDEKGNQALLRFGEHLESEQGDWHAKILRRFFEEIEFEYETFEGLASRSEIPEIPNNIPYKIVGMGRCYTTSDIAVFYGDSEDYRMGIDKDHLRLRASCSSRKICVEI